MQAISLKPPAPYAILHQGKPVENRSWRTDYRGPLLLHASKRWCKGFYEFILDRIGGHVPSKEHHVFGAIVGIVNMVDCVSEFDSPWFCGDYGFVFENPREFNVPIPYLGQLGLFEVPDSLLERYDVLFILQAEELKKKT